MIHVGVLFTNNLRVKDNTVLDAACKEGNTVFPLYFHDENLKNSEEFGIRDIGLYRAKFLYEAVENLRENLEKLGSHLSILRGDSIKKVVDFSKEHNISKIYMQESVGSYEMSEIERLRDMLAKENIALYTIWDHTLVYKDDLPFYISELPQVFTQFRKQIEKNAEIVEILPELTEIVSGDVETTETLTLKDFGYEEVDIDDRRAIELIGGEDAAWERLNHYFWDTESLSEYKHTRNGLIGPDYSSKFSPWLAHGCISARSIYWEVKKYEKQIKKNSSTYWLVFELLWRDFFQFVFLEKPKRFFHNYPDDEEILGNDSEKRKFEKWKQGSLGIPFVDANMRELALTGFMSNRGRQNVASYLVNDLKLDWRLGAKYFESLLVDYDIASNWGNWAYVAGVGNDPRDNRYFNIERQASMYDKDGKYQKLWNS